MKTRLIKLVVLLPLCSLFAVSEAKTLIFNEDFEGGELNLAVWNVEDNCRGGGNAEMQYYAPKNITVEKAPTGESCLVLNAIAENYKNRPATSGRVNTQGKFSFKYGTMEVRVMFPKTADGLWPAIWLLGDNLAPSLGNDDSIDKQKCKLKRQGYVIWPKCGEIDLLEMGHADGIKNGKQDRFFNGACHWGEDFNDGKYPNHVMNKEVDYSLQDGEFHLVTLEWTKDSILMFMDRDRFPEAKPYFSLAIDGKAKKNRPARYFHHPFYLVINLAVGGYFTGLPAPEKYPAVISSQYDKFRQIATTALPADGTPAKLYIDYIRIYQ